MASHRDSPYAPWRPESESRAHRRWVLDVRRLSKAEIEYVTQARETNRKRWRCFSPPKTNKERASELCHRIRAAMYNIGWRTFIGIRRGPAPCVQRASEGSKHWEATFQFYWIRDVKDAGLCDDGILTTHATMLDQTPDYRLYAAAWVEWHRAGYRLRHGHIVTDGRTFTRLAGRDPAKAVRQWTETIVERCARMLA